MSRLESVLASGQVDKQKYPERVKTLACVYKHTDAQLSHLLQAIHAFGELVVNSDGVFVLIGLLAFWKASVAWSMVVNSENMN